MGHTGNSSPKEALGNRVIGHAVAVQVAVYEDKILQAGALIKDDIRTTITNYCESFQMTHDSTYSLVQFLG